MADRSARTAGRPRRGPPDRLSYAGAGRPAVGGKHEYRAGHRRKCHGADVLAAVSVRLFLPALHNTWRHRSVVMQHFWLLNWLAFLSMAAFNGLVYLGMQYTVAINGNLLQGSLPICIMVAEYPHGAR